MIRSNKDTNFQEKWTLEIFYLSVFKVQWTLNFGNAWIKTYLEAKLVFENFCESEWLQIFIRLGSCADSAVYLGFKSIRQTIHSE